MWLFILFEMSRKCLLYICQVSWRSNCVIGWIQYISIIWSNWSKKQKKKNILMVRLIWANQMPLHICNFNFSTFLLIKSQFRKHFFWYAHNKLMDKLNRIILIDTTQIVAFRSTLTFVFKLCISGINWLTFSQRDGVMCT